MINKLDFMKPVFVGVIIGIFIILTVLSFSTLIFSGPLSSFFPIGAAAGLLGAFILMIIVTIFSSSSLAIAAPQDTCAIMTTLVVSSIVSQIGATSPIEQILPTIIVVIMVITATVGGIMLLLGWQDMGRLVRFMPYTIISGFIAGTGLLLVKGGINSCLNLQEITGVLSYFTPKTISVWLMPLGFGLILFVAQHITKRFIITPCVIILGFLAFVLYLHYNNLSFLQAQQFNWTMGPFPEGSIANIPSLQAFQGKIHWNVVLNYFPEYITAAALAVIGLLLNISSFELISKNEMCINRELSITGGANLLSSIFGGFGGYQWLSFSLFGFKQGVSTRLVGLIAGVCCAGFLFLNTSILMYIPKFITGAFLVYIGIDLIYDWLIKIINKVSKIDYLIILSISITILWFGLLTGITLGMLLALILFFVHYSNISAIRYIGNANITHSNIERNIIAQETLIKQKEKVLIVFLHGYLFFGNARAMSEELIEKLTSDELKYEAIIIDFTQVNGLELTGADAIYQFLVYTSNENIRVILTNLQGKLKYQLDKIDDGKGLIVTFDSINQALICMEEDYIKKAHPNLVTFENEVLEKIFSSMSVANQVLSYSTKKEIKKGEILFYQNDKSDSFYFITRGSFEVIVNYNKTNENKLKVVSSGSIIGEIGLYLQQPRGATLVACEDSIVYEISQTKLYEIEQSDHVLSGEIQKAIIRLTSKRLQYANKMAGYYANIL